MLEMVSIRYTATAITTENEQRASSPHTSQDTFMKPTANAARAPVKRQHSIMERKAGRDEGMEDVWDATKHYREQDNHHFD